MFPKCSLLLLSLYEMVKKKKTITNIKMYIIYNKKKIDVAVVPTVKIRPSILVYKRVG